MNKILSQLELFTLLNGEEIARSMAADFRRRRIEKNLTREQLAEKSGVAVPRPCFPMGKGIG